MTDLTPENLRQARILEKVSTLVNFLKVAKDLDAIENAVGGESNEYRETRQELMAEKARLEARRNNAFKLPLLLRRFDPGIPTDPTHQTIRDKALSALRTKPLSPQKLERLETLNIVLGGLRQQ